MLIAILIIANLNAVFSASPNNRTISKTTYEIKKTTSRYSVIDWPFLSLRVKRSNPILNNLNNEIATGHTKEAE